MNQQERSVILNELSIAENYFSKVFNTYECLVSDVARGELAFVNNARNNHTTIKTKWVPNIVLALLLWILVFFALTIFIDRTIASLGVFNELSVKMSSLLKFFFLFISSVVITFAFFALLQRRAKKKSENIHKIIMQQADELEQKYEHNKVVLINHYNNYPQGDCPIPFCYSHPEDISTLAHYIRSMRADSVKEAINAWIEDEHRDKIVTAQNQLLENSKKILQYQRVNVLMNFAK